MIQVNPRLGAIAVLNGDLDFTTTFGTTLRSILQGGFPVKFVFVSVKKSEHSLIVRPEIKDIKGLSVSDSGCDLAGLGSASRRRDDARQRIQRSALKIVALGDSLSHAGHSRWSRGRDRHRSAAGSDAETEGYTILAGPQDVEIALPTSGLAVTSRMLQENPQLIKRTLRAMLKAHKFVFENRRETLQIMMRWLEQSAEVAERSYELAAISLSRRRRDQ